MSAGALNAELVELITTPGPVRSAAVRAAAASLRMDVGLCGDRARAAAAHALDKGLLAAIAAQDKRANRADR